MKTLQGPRFKELSQGECAGAPAFRQLWDRFDFSLLLTQSGIMKRSGAPTWLLAFLYVIGLVAGCSSVLQMAELAGKDALLKAMFAVQQITQCAMSRFLTHPFAWRTFGKKRVTRLQEDSDTQLRNGDVVNLDDTLAAHPYAKELPFLCWLRDHARKVNVWGMNIVALQAVLKSGLEYPLFYAVWRKIGKDETGLTKLDLARQMLLMLRESVSCRLWVAMDRWYLCKEFFVFLMANGYDWVTKAKRNTALFQRVIEPGTGRERFVPVTPIMLIKAVFKDLIKLGSSGLVGIAIPDIYMKLPYTVTNRNGKRVEKQRLVPIAAVVATRLKEDEETAHGKTDDDNESPATYRGAYLIISNRHDVPLQALGTYVKRWRIEVFFRTAKQELGFEKCHSTSEAHHHAHLELLFAAETLLAYALWQLNKEKTSDDEGCTHGEMVRGLFHTRCQINTRTHKGKERVYVDFDIQAQQFASLFRLFWPESLDLRWFSKSSYQELGRSA
ncbi:transposase [Cohnella thermotolerans]|uniref:transposase n=1 Tax=Cohnella thermotolerans TaxID=329858 RepID=UPI001F0AFDB9|nr:transposase [Cohnella thermotolerans]